MTQGYIRSRPDTAWWDEQIRAGLAFRKRAAFEEKWPMWREFYRGEWGKGVMPVNLFFTMMRTMVPRIYFRNPTVSVMPAKPGFLNLAFSRVLERVDNAMLRQMEYKAQMKRIVRDTIMKGTGIGKLGFGGFYSPSAENAPLPIGKKGDRVEYLATAKANMPWFSRVATKNFIVATGTCDFDTNRWTCEEIRRPLEDVIDDPRFENTQGLRTAEIAHITVAGGILRPVKDVKLYEVHDWKTGKTFVYAPDHSKPDKVIFYDDDAFQNYGSSNYFPLVFNDDDEDFWGVPDSQIIEPYQLELNEIRTQIMKHRRISLIKILVRTNGMDPEEAEKLVSEDVGAVAWIKGQGSIDNIVKVLQQSIIPRELFLAADAVMQDTRETLGLGRNQFGEFNSRSGDTTATEASIVNQAMDIRVDEKRDAVADYTVRLVETMHGLLFDHWGTNEVVDVVGPGGLTVWVRLRPELLKAGRYTIRIDPDSSLPETKDRREQRALLLFRELKANPLIDPIKLTQYLLHELQGPQFDDMMRMMPPPQGYGGEAVEPEQFAGMMSNGFQQVAAGNVNPQLQLSA
jgi:hypothetical protein